jgi:tetratricopeptide (TPR) repeat protein
MPTKNDDTPTAPATDPAALAFEAAIARFAEGVGLIHKGDFDGARQIFVEVQSACADEPELIERAKSYALICERRMAPTQPPLQTADDRFYRAVVLSNNGRYDEALALLDPLIQEDPTSARSLYARASAWALKGTADRAVVDLRQAIAIDPKVRFQAVNDPDFEKIREEPSFIDIIEPTPTGA